MRIMDPPTGNFPMAQGPGTDLGAMPATVSATVMQFARIR